MRMTATWRRLGPIALAACAAGVIADTGRGDDQGIEWLGDYRAALQQARAAHKPLLVEFRCEA